MIHLFFNALAASAGGGLTYVRNVVPHLSARDDVRATILLSAQLRRELPSGQNICFLEMHSSPGSVRRFWREQRRLPALIRQSGAGVLISTGNFALRNSPVPQILLSRNSLYTSADFFRDLRRRRDYSIWLDTRIKGLLARRSLRWADCTVAPSSAFAQELQAWTGVKAVAIHHGFDRDAFFGNHAPLPDDIRTKLAQAEGTLRLLFVSHYNYYRNFETLIRALPLLQRQLPERKIRLFLTCKLRFGDNPGSYRPDSAATLVQQLGASENVVELGAVPYGLLQHVYRACDIYVTPAYAESFAHPVLEAMASEKPVVATDLPVHQEICGDAALYFPRFSSEVLADQVARLATSPDLAQELSQKALQRSRDFSWSKHVDQMIALASGLIFRRPLTTEN